EAVAQELSVLDKPFCPTVLWPQIPIWQLEVPKVDFGLLEIKARNKAADMGFEFQCYVRERYADHLLLFIDGSKDQGTGATGAAFMVQGFNVQLLKRTSDFLNVFTVKLCAILMAVQWTELQHHNVLVVSDSVPAITSTGTGTAQSRQDLIHEILM
ncbi:hypothetical protein ABVT39_009897, partial [Epinephelus coioides]